MRYLLHQKFNPDELEATNSVEFGYYGMKINDTFIAKLQVWDTAGRERHPSMVETYFSDSVCVMLVFDLTDRQSFD